MKRSPAWLTVAVLVASLLGALLTAVVQRSAVAPTARAELTNGPGLTVTVDTNGTGGAYAAVSGGLRPDRRVHVLVDGRYPLLLASPRSVKGTYDHLSIDLPQGGWTEAIDRVDADGFAAAMRNDPGSVAVVSSGALPDTVLGPANDWAPVRDFLRGGGELVFIGDGAFYWAANRNTSTFTLSNRHERIDWVGEQSVLGGHVVDDVAGRNLDGTVFATTRTTASRSLGIAYTVATHGALLSQLTAMGGWDLGYDTTAAHPRSSLAVVPVGAGRLVLFGGGVYEAETSIDEDISRVLLSGSDIAPPSVVADAVVPAHTTRALDLSAPTASTDGARVLVYQENAFPYFHTTVRVPRR